VHDFAWGCGEKLRRGLQKIEAAPFAGRSFAFRKFFQMVVFAGNHGPMA